MQCLGRGYLKQNLLRAIRLWVWLRHLIEREIKQPQQQQSLLKILSKRSPTDAYYQVFIRYQDNEHRDNNIVMRLIS
ncbi:hypothetical protein [Nostoc sp.]|uniref:hypothetical protein n=1 Tax=Nostoc sp. TaxID=1180 RepID=UPI002FFD07EF